MNVEQLYRAVCQELDRRQVPYIRREVLDLLDDSSLDDDDDILDALDQACDDGHHAPGLWLIGKVADWYEERHLMPS